MTDAEQDLQQLIALARQAVAASFTGHYEAAKKAHSEHYQRVCEKCADPAYHADQREAVARLLA